MDDNNSTPSDKPQEKAPKKCRWLRRIHRDVMSEVLPFDLQEVRALIHHASGQGLDPSGMLLGPLNTSVNEYEHLAEEKVQERSVKAAEVLARYAELSKLTHPVNGRTLLDSLNFAWNTKGLFLYAFLFLILALGTEMLDLYLQDAVLPVDGPLVSIVLLHTYVLDFLSPLFWGGLGSCVFLLKRLGEVASKRQYDDRLFRGWNARVWVGAILAQRSGVLL